MKPTFSPARSRNSTGDVGGKAITKKRNRKVCARGAVKYRGRMCSKISVCCDSSTSACCYIYTHPIRPFYSHESFSTGQTDTMFVVIARVVKRAQSRTRAREGAELHS